MYLIEVIFSLKYFYVQLNDYFYYRTLSLTYTLMVLSFNNTTCYLLQIPAYSVPFQMVNVDLSLIPKSDRQNFRNAKITDRHLIRHRAKGVACLEKSLG